MLVVISPAKKIVTTGIKPNESSIPTFIKNAEKLINTLRKLSPNDIKKLMSISNDLAELNYQRYLLWNKKHDVKSCKQAMFMFTGEVYAGLKATSFNDEELTYAQQHLRILSGLYGVLKPLDLTYPYRLEMGTKLSVENTKNLYQFWGDQLVNEINKQLTLNKEKTLVNLASNEYFKAINTKKLNANVITPVFKDFNNGTYKTVMVYAKKARGQMAAFILKNKLTTVDDLIAFNDDGYLFNKAASTAKELVFYRG